jgi:hypothetical protein
LNWWLEVTKRTATWFYKTIMTGLLLPTRLSGGVVFEFERTIPANKKVPIVVSGLLIQDKEWNGGLIKLLLRNIHQSIF